MHKRWLDLLQTTEFRKTKLILILEEIAFLKYNQQEVFLKLKKLNLNQNLAHRKAEFNK